MPYPAPRRTPLSRVLWGSCQLPLLLSRSLNLPLHLPLHLPLNLPLHPAAAPETGSINSGLLSRPWRPSVAQSAWSFGGDWEGGDHAD